MPKLPTTCLALLLSLVAIAACSSRQETARDCLGRPVDAVSPATGTALLTWNAPLTRTDGSPFDNLLGYRIYYGVKPDELNCKVEIRDAKETSS